MTNDKKENNNKNLDENLEIKIFSKEKLEENKKKKKREKIKEKNISKIKGLKEKKEKEAKKKQKEEQKKNKQKIKTTKTSKKGNANKNTKSKNSNNVEIDLENIKPKARLFKFTTIYYILLIITTLILIILPKEESLKDIDNLIKIVEVKNDGTLYVEEKITFEKTNFDKYIFELTNDTNIKNVKVYEENFFGKTKLDTEVTNKSYTINKNLKTKSYVVTYDTTEVTKNMGDIYSVNIPTLITKDEWINNYYIEVVFPKTLNNEKFKLFTNALPKNNMQISDNKVRIKGTNFPENLSSGINIFVNENQFLNEYSKNFTKYELLNFEEVNNFEEETFKNYQKLREKRDYSRTITRKYLNLTLYLIISLIIFNYILGIIFNIRKNSYRINKVKEKNNIKLKMDLVRVFAILRKRVYLDKVDTQNLISSIIIKLEGLGYIKIKSDYLILEELNSKKKEKLLNEIDLELLSIIKLAKPKNDNLIYYTHLENVFLENSKVFIQKLETIEKEKIAELITNGVYSKKTYRVNFRPIIILIPVLTIFSIFDYINIYQIAAIIASLFVIAKFDVSLSKDNYTKLGVKLRKDLIAYEKYLKTVARVSLNEKNMNYLKILKKDPTLLDKIIRKIRELKNTLIEKLGFIEKESVKEKRLKDNVFAKLFGLYPFGEEKEIRIISLTHSLMSYLEITKLLKLPSKDILEKFNVKVDDELNSKYDHLYK